MKNKFNLKQEREKLFKKYRLLDGCKNMILEQDEEFIRLLKEETTFCKIACSEGCLARRKGYSGRQIGTKFKWR